MFEFTSLFLSNLLGDSLFSLVPSTTTLSGYTTVMSGATTSGAIMDDDIDTLSGSSISYTASTLGTSVVNSVDSAYQATKKQLQVTDAYIESLNEDELTYLIEKLEEKEKILLTKEDNKINIKIDNNKTKTLKWF